jgi:hypothetical protein
MTGTSAAIAAMAAALSARHVCAEAEGFSTFLHR